MAHFDNLNGVMLCHVKLFCFEVFIENGNVTEALLLTSRQMLVLSLFNTFEYCCHSCSGNGDPQQPTLRQAAADMILTYQRQVWILISFQYTECSFLYVAFIKVQLVWTNQLVVYKNE